MSDDDRTTTPDEAGNTTPGGAGDAMPDGAGRTTPDGGGNTVPDEGDVFASTVPPDAPARPGRARRLLTVVLPAVLVLGAVGGGVTYTGVTVAAADRTADTVVWEEPDTKAKDEDPATAALRGKSSTPLSKLLLPAPSGYDLGPDVETFGNDGELGAKEATALLKEQAKGLSGKKRRDYEKRIDRLGVQGVGVRTFVSSDTDLVVYVHITQMKDKKRIRDMFELRKEISGLLKFPKGPKIDGHTKSFCNLIPSDKSLSKKEQAYQLDGMVCAAYDSDVYVTVTAAGVKPFDKSAVAALVKKQMDHIESPGEYI
ncbi:hypothetical protein [Streptomyces sp. NBC_01216]|uniref:hypothetical protein n=1 Tax=unclassified Streptomyces TaxID=2593676 RepID=UPI002E0E9A80|nr:hypothetical protein OG393_13935 [Streptomyces sp. NBC_01216]